ncbi:MAG: hypothetical protein QOJ99_5245 [Bryobacterales bacterium]|jgi:hypothetical protein|nr:hypothetical protein [Bryobacterales bacterium]
MLLTFSEAGPGIGIPYDRSERPDGTNHGYIDLKRSPESIHSIPELKGYPELFRFIEDANRDESVFRTAGCAVSISAGDGGNYIHNSFIHLLFEILHWNTSPTCYRLLFEEFRDRMARQENRLAHASVLFSLGPTSFWQHGFDGCSLRVFVEGRGQSEAMARDNWQSALVSLSLFLRDFSAAYQPQLQNCLRRVS